MTASNMLIKKNLPFDVFEVKLIDADDAALLQLSAGLGIGLSLGEMRVCREYFTGAGRNPTDVEIQTIGQTWSEHCYHKTFKGDVITPEGKTIARNLLKTYIASVTKELNPDWCISVFEDNAGIVTFEDGYAIAAKVETHNHPSAIEPFGGAATGIGGVIRDILGVWAEPVANTDVLCFGPLDYQYDKLPLGVKHPSYIFRGVVAGIGCYGNNMGIPTVNGAIYFDESYVGNVVVYCGCVGLLPLKEYVKDTRVGDVAVLAGGRTGRDGIHGVTFASAELTEKSEEVSRPAVQIPNPIEEEKLTRAIMEVRDRGLGSAVTDLGGGGLSCAIGEMAHRFHLGVTVKLDKVPLKYTGMTPWEIWVSESQERMLLSVRDENLAKALKIFEYEDVEATPIGRFTTDGVLRVKYRGVNVAELNLGFLFNPPHVTRVAQWDNPSFTEPSFDTPEDLTATLLGLLPMPDSVSKEKVVRTYDHEVKGNTVLKPLQGKHAGPNDAAVIKPLPNSYKGVVISSGMNPSYGKVDPYWMAASAIDEALRNNVAVGGRRIALLDNFTWGNPEKPDRMGALLRAVQACYDTAKAFETPFISGKDSLYNESPLGPVTPTLLITAIGLIPDIRKTVSTDLKKPGNPVYMVGQTLQELGGSAYYRSKGFIGNTVPRVNAAHAKNNMDAVTAALDAGYVKACHDLSEGGLGTAAVEMTLASDYGMAFSLSRVPAVNLQRNDFILFSESNSRFLVEVERGAEEFFRYIMHGKVYAEVGRVLEEPVLRVYGYDGKPVVEISSEILRQAWRKGLGV